MKKGKQNEITGNSRRSFLGRAGLAVGAALIAFKFDTCGRDTTGTFTFWAVQGKRKNKMGDQS
jgi:hypothetical protein